MAGPTKEFWEQRFAEGNKPWDRGASSPQLAAWLRAGLLKPCRILVPGCGSGYVSRSIRNSPLRTIEISPPLNDGGGKCRRESKLKWSLSPPCRAATAARRLGCPRPGWAGRSRWSLKSVGRRCTV
ncbi:MAG TPA: hypothetical protein VIK33_00030 [Anaerolineae bacterium]